MGDQAALDNNAGRGGSAGGGLRGRRGRRSPTLGAMPAALSAGPTHVHGVRGAIRRHPGSVDHGRARGSSGHSPATRAPLGHQHTQHGSRAPVLTTVKGTSSRASPCIHSTMQAGSLQSRPRATKGSGSISSPPPLHPSPPAARTSGRRQTSTTGSGPSKAN